MLLLIESLQIDPNIIYLGLVLGLWMGVTAAYIAGTGLAEVAAFVLLLGSFLALMSMPTNWVAVLVLIIGVSAFLILPLFFPKMAKWAATGLALQAVGGFFLFDGLLVSPILIAITILVAWAYHQYLLMPLLDKKRPTDYDEATRIIGARGRVIKMIDPVGMVNVQGETWSARSDDPLPPDTPVVVIGQDGLELQVAKAKRDEIEPLSPIATSFGSSEN